MLVYKITNILNSDCYIGQTKRSLKQRWKEHCNPKGAGNIRYLKHAIAKYGIENFVVETLGFYDSAEDLNNAEQYFISFHNSQAPHGYNLHSGGQVYEVTEETRKKLSEAHTGQVPTEFNKQQSRKANCGRPTWNAGKKGCVNAGSFTKGCKAPNLGRKLRIDPISGKRSYVNG